MRAGDDPTKGHCYIAAEAAYWIFGWREKYTPQVITGPGYTHWYLKHRITGHIVDPTATQWGKTRIPYERGRGTGFLTRKPSKRCLELIRRVRRHRA
jgi:hypothetical protein